MIYVEGLSYKCELKRCKIKHVMSFFFVCSYKKKNQWYFKLNVCNS